MTSNVPSTKLAPYIECCLELDEQFQLTHLHEPKMTNVAFLALALAGEVGELVNVVKKIWRDGESPELWQKFDEEMVDILIYFSELVNTTRCPLDAAWKEKHEILRKRMKDKIGYSLDDCVLGLPRP